MVDIVTRSCWSCVICGVVARLTPNLELRSDSNAATPWRIVVQYLLSVTDTNIIVLDEFDLLSIVNRSVGSP